MTNPTITYSHGFLTDCDSATNWTETASPTLTSTGLTVLYNDIFKLTGTASTAGQYTYWEYDLTNISSDTFTKFLIRYKTSASSTGLGAKVELVFTSGTQIILDTSFSTVWKVASGTITKGKTIDKIRLYAVSDAASSGEYVLYDFILLCKGTFTFPQCDDVSIDLTNVYADLTPPTRVGDVTQYLAMNSPIIRLTGKIDVDTSNWGSPYGEYLLYIWREACSDPWQWFTSDLINCKVTPRAFHISQSSDSKALRVWNCELRKYDKSSGAETTWSGKQYYGFES